MCRQDEPSFPPESFERKSVPDAEPPEVADLPAEDPKKVDISQEMNLEQLCKEVWPALAVIGGVDSGLKIGGQCVQKSTGRKAMLLGALRKGHPTVKVRLLGGPLGLSESVLLASFGGIRTSLLMSSRMYLLFAMGLGMGQVISRLPHFDLSCRDSAKRYQLKRSLPVKTCFLGPLFPSPVDKDQPINQF